MHGCSLYFWGTLLPKIVQGFEVLPNCHCVCCNIFIKQALLSKKIAALINFAKKVRHAPVEHIFPGCRCATQASRVLSFATLTRILYHIREGLQTGEYCLQGCRLQQLLHNQSEAARQIECGYCGSMLATLKMQSEQHSLQLLEA